MAFTLAVHVIHVLEYIHSHGYAHNDVKAQNMLLGHGRGKVKITIKLINAYK